jgi:hypothetical protein
MVARADRHAARAAALAHSDPLRAAFHAARAEHHRAQLRFGADKRRREDDDDDERSASVPYPAVRGHCTYVLPGRFSKHDALELARIPRSTPAQLYYFGRVVGVDTDNVETDFPRLLSSSSLHEDIGRTAVPSVDINVKSKLASALKNTLTKVEVAKQLHQANRILFLRLMMHLYAMPDEGLAQLTSRRDALQPLIQSGIITEGANVTSAIEALAETLLYYDTAMLQGYDMNIPVAAHVIDRMASLAPIQTSGDGPEFAIFADWDDLGSVLLVRHILAARAGNVTLVATGTPVSTIAAQKALMWARMLGEWLHEAYAQRREGETGVKRAKGETGIKRHSVERSIRVKLASDSRQNTWVNSDAQQVRGVYDRRILLSYREDKGSLTKNSDGLKGEIDALVQGKAMTITVDRSLTVRTLLGEWPPPTHGFFETLLRAIGF